LDRKARRVVRLRGYRHIVFEELRRGMVSYLADRKELENGKVMVRRGMVDCRLAGRKELESAKVRVRRSLVVEGIVVGLGSLLDAEEERSHPAVEKGKNNLAVGDILRPVRSWVEENIEVAGHTAAVGRTVAGLVDGCLDCRRSNRCST